MLTLAATAAGPYPPSLSELGEDTMIVTLYMLLLSIVTPAANAEPYVMNDVGGTLALPAGFEMARWSDWDFKAKGANGAIMYKLWLTPFQSPIDKQSGKGFAVEYQRKLAKEGGGDASIKSTEIKTLGGRDTVITEMHFKAKGGKGTEGVYIGAAFAGAGQVIHSRVIASKRKAKAARVALEEMLSTFTLKRGPVDVVTGEVSSDAGFSGVLPEGWRLPLEPEQAAVLAITSGMWKGDMGKEECFLGIKPPAIGEPDVLFACKKFWDGTPVDEHSFSDIEAEWRTIFFGKAGAELSPGESIVVGDRTGALYRPRDGANPIRLLVAPFDGGLMALWLRGASLDAAAADAAMVAIAPTIKFTGPDGGHPLVRPDRWVSYYINYRPTHPFVFLPLLLIVGGIVVMVRRGRGKDPYADLEDEI